MTFIDHEDEVTKLNEGTPVSEVLPTDEAKIRFLMDADIYLRDYIIERLPNAVPMANPSLFWKPTFFVIACFALFCIGLGGFIFNRSHIVLTIISAELMLLASFLSFAHASFIWQDPAGNVYALMILVLAAAESAIGLALIVKIHRLRKTVMLASLRFLRG
jgi:NADH-quinone oxidoreductase subunit K